MLLLACCQYDYNALDFYTKQRNGWCARGKDVMKHSRGSEKLQEISYLLSLATDNHQK